MVERFYTARIEQAEGASPDEGFGVVFPDFPGCVSFGRTVQEAAENAAEALALHVEGMIDDDEPIPPPSDPTVVPDWLADASTRAVALMLVPVSVPGHAVRANVTLDSALLARLDRAAAAAGKSRSGFIAEAVRERLRRVHETA